MRAPLPSSLRRAALALLLAIASSAHAGLLWQDTVSAGGPDGQANAVVTAAGRVHVAGFITAPESSIALVRTYDEATGALLWDSRVPIAFELGDLAIEDGRLFAIAFVARGTDSGSQEWAVVAYDAASGAELWQDVRDDGPFGHASRFATASGRLFAVGTGSTDASAAAFVVRALDAATGEQLWQDSPGPAGTDGSFAIATGDGRVFAAGPVDGHVQLAAYAQEDGRELWSAPGAALPYFGKVSGLVFAGGRVLLATDLHDSVLVQAYDAASGVLVWQHDVSPDDARQIVAEVALAADERVAAIGYWSGGQHLVAWDAATGAPLWRDDDTRATRDLQIDAGVLWALGGVSAFQVRACDAASGRGLWSSTFIPQHSSLALARSGSRAFVAGVAGPGFGTFDVTALDTSVPAELRAIAPGARRLTTTR